MKPFNLWARQPQGTDTQYLATPFTISKRCLAFVFEESRSSWRRAVGKVTLSKEYTRLLQAAAASLVERHRLQLQHILVVNLGPAWCSPEVYQSIGKNVLEFHDSAWESPPGLGICPLDVLFSACSSISSWLASDPSHTVVLHSRSCSGVGLRLLQLVVACHALFAMECSELTAAVEGLEAAGLAGAAPPPKSVMTSGDALLNRYLGVAQQQYGSYVARVLYQKNLPHPRQTLLLLSRVVFSAWQAGDQLSLARSVLAVHERGQQVWAGPAEAQGDLVGFHVDSPVIGDICIGVWFGDHKGEWDQPALSFAFHTAFLGAGVDRISVPQLEVPPHSPLRQLGGAAALGPAFFMDITLEDTHQRFDSKKQRAADVADVRRLRGSWRDQMLAAGVPEAAFRHAKDDLMAEMAAVQGAGLKPSEVRRFSHEGAAAAPASSSASPPPPAAALPAGNPPHVDHPVIATAGKSAPPPPPPPLRKAPAPAPSVSAAKGGGAAVPPPAPPPPGRKVPASPPPAPAPKTKSSAAAPAAAPTPSAAGASVTARAPRYRVLHWTKAPAAPGTLWQELQVVPPLRPPVAHALDHLFTARAAAPSRGGGTGAAKGGAVAVRVITAGRANNIAIMLTQFPGMGPHRIRAAVLRSSSELGVERLSLLLQMAPTPPEVKGLQQYSGPWLELCTAEQLLSVLASVPRLRAKLEALLFMRQFPPLTADATVGLACMQAACQQVRSSGLLREVLRAVLAAGNTLNAGTSHGGAQGFRLATLLKLADVKVTSLPAGGAGGEAAAAVAVPPPAPDGAPPIRTLLEFVAWMVHHGRGSADDASACGGSRQLSRELSLLEGAARRLQGELQEALSALEVGCAAADAEQRAAASAASNLVGSSAAFDILSAGANSIDTATAPHVENGSSNALHRINGVNDGSNDGHADSHSKTDLTMADDSSCNEGLHNAPSASGIRQQTDLILQDADVRGTCPPDSRPYASERQDAVNGEVLLDAASVARQAAGREQNSQIATEEAHFAALLCSFLTDALAQRQALLQLSAQAQTQVSDLLVWLGEPADADASSVFGTLWSFAVMFDNASRNLQTRMRLWP